MNRTGANRDQIRQRKGATRTPPPGETARLLRGQFRLLSRQVQVWVTAISLAVTPSGSIGGQPQPFVAAAEAPCVSMFFPAQVQTPVPALSLAIAVYDRIESGETVSNRAAMSAPNVVAWCEVKAS